MIPIGGSYNDMYACAFIVEPFCGSLPLAPRSPNLNKFVYTIWLLVYGVPVLLIVVRVFRFVLSCCCQYYSIGNMIIQDFKVISANISLVKIESLFSAYRKE